MKPSQILIPRLLPIFKHGPEISTTNIMFNPSAQLLSDQFTRTQNQGSSSSYRTMNNIDNASSSCSGWNTWWVSNPNPNVSQQGKGSNIVKGRNQNMNDHTHTQTSVKYHNPHNRHNDQYNITKPSINYDSITTSTTTVNLKQDQNQNKTQDIRSKSRTKVKGKDKDKSNNSNSNSNSNVPPATIKWNDHLSMV